MALHRNVCSLVALTEYSMCKATPHRRYYKKKRCVYNLLADWKHTSDSSLPIKGKSSDGLPGWSLDRAFIKLSALLRQFQQLILLRSSVCKCVVLWMWLWVLRERPPLSVFSQMNSHWSNNTLTLHQIYNRLLSVVVQGTQHLWCRVSGTT